MSIGAKRRGEGSKTQPKDGNDSDDDELLWRLPRSAPAWGCKWGGGVWYLQYDDDDDDDDDEDDDSLVEESTVLLWCCWDFAR